MNLESDKPDTAPSDEALAEAVKQGDDKAFDALVKRHQGVVFAVAYRMMSNREDALDVAQEVYIKAYRKIHTWKPSGSFRAWLLRLTSNQSIDHIRRRKRHYQKVGENVAGIAAEQTVFESLAADGERKVYSFEIESRVQEALSVLSPSQRTAFVLRHYEGMPLAEIAPVLGCTVGSVKVHLFRALKKLRVELSDLCE